MKRIKMILLASVAAVALSVVGASAASAGTGTVSIGGGAPCDITFDSTGGPTDPSPNSVFIDNVNESTTDPDCTADIKNPDTFLDVDFAGNGTLSASGVIKVSVFGVNCTYNVPATAGTNGANSASISTTLNKTAGSFLCPDPVAGAINVTSF